MSKSWSTRATVWRRLIDQDDAHLPQMPTLDDESDAPDYRFRLNPILAND